VLQSTLGVRKWKIVKPSNKAPPPRQLSQTAIALGRMWVVRGSTLSEGEESGEQGHELSDCWSLDLETWSWSEVDLKGEETSSNARHLLSPFQMSAVGSKLWIYNPDCGKSILVIDTTTGTLARHPVSGQTPSRGGLSSMVCSEFSGTPCLYIFGGGGSAGDEVRCFNDVYCLNTETLVWRKLDVQGRAPEPRCSAGCVARGAQLRFYGGTTQPLQAQDSSRTSSEAALLGDFFCPGSAANGLDVASAGRTPSGTSLRLLNVWDGGRRDPAAWWGGRH